MPIGRPTIYQTIKIVNSNTQVIIAYGNWYFIAFNKYTNGQTLGKKVMRLKIVNSKDIDAKVPIWSYLVRAIILYQPIYYLVKLLRYAL